MESIIDCDKAEQIKKLYSERVSRAKEQHKLHQEQQKIERQLQTISKMNQHFKEKNEEYRKTLNEFKQGLLKIAMDLSENNDVNGCNQLVNLGLFNIIDELTHLN